MLKELKKFAMRCNIVDLAVGVIIGSAFGRIVTSMVGDALVPAIGSVMGNVDLSNLFVSLDPEKTGGIKSLMKAKETGAAVIAYGSFTNTVIDFLIVALCVFLLVKAVNCLKITAEEAPPTIKECPYCLSTILIKASRCAHCISELK